MKNKYIQNNNKISLFNIITVLLISYITISSIFPPLRTLTSNNILLTSLCMVFWFIITFFRSPNFYIKPTMHRFITLIFILYTFLIPYLLDKSAIGNRYLSIAPIFFLYIVYEYNTKTYRFHNNIKIIQITSIFAFITLIKTGKGLIQNPYLSRSIKSSGSYTINLLKQGVGGYEFIYFLTLLLPILIYITFLSDIIKKRYQKILLVLICVLVFSVIILSNYFTALVISLLSILIMIIIKITQRQKGLAIILIIIVLMITSTVGKELAINILNWISSWLSEGLTLQRINDMKNSINYGNGIGITTSRWSLIEVSIKSFLHNPVIGILGNTGTILLNFKSNVGQHSHLIDTFAFLGAIPGLMQIYIIFQPYIRRIRDGKANELIISFIFSLAMVLTLNNATPSMGIIIGLALPITYRVLKPNK